MIPSAPKQPNDMIDLLFESVQKVKERYDGNGMLQVTMEPDNKLLNYRTLLIPNPNFGGCILEVEHWISLMKDAKNNMCSEMADVIYQQGMDLVEDYLYAFASKSSETVRDKDNTMQSLLHLVQRNHMEKTVRIEDKAKDGISKAMGLSRDEPVQY